MSTPKTDHPILELRVALTAADYERAVKFYCEGLGIEAAQVWDGDQGLGRLLDMGHATLELFDEEQAAMVDWIEAGRRISGQIRFALQVPDLEAATVRLLAHGGTLVHPAILTPWGDHNVRFQDPDGIQLTLFEVASKKGSGE